MKFEFLKTKVFLLCVCSILTRCGNIQITNGNGSSSSASSTTNALNDEFSTTFDLLASAHSTWSVLGFPVDATHTSTRALTMDIDTTKAGWAVIIPQETNYYSWFQDYWGPLMYKNVTGNFVVVTHLRVVDKTNTSAAPALGYNAGGIVIRDPAGTHSSDENWVMYNLGGQSASGISPDPGFAREIKKTLNSASELFLNPHPPADGLEEHMLICRVGNIFRFYYWDNTDGNWRQEAYYNAYNLNGTSTSTGSATGPTFTGSEFAAIPPASGSSTPIYFDHSSMPSTVQVGIMGHTYNGTHNTRAEFDYVRFASTAPTSESDCLTEFSNLGNE
ncbi:MAG: hypothetical protein CL678_16225 [Bdellovibrionaceae bacterium]|nr:hypothetical protein [Pseudobdellovibrionaceae bacterium]|tara:strand:+ start:879 stop:1874 length:996 start_codon:yes stop_codon:yes gene_type:complete